MPIASRLSRQRPRRPYADSHRRKSLALSASLTAIFGNWSLKGRGPPRHRTAVGAIQSKTSSAAGDLDSAGKGARRYLPHRRDGEPLQVISVMNFKGGSGKTTTAAHLAQYLALRGYRVLAIDLDPQASLSALFGHQPELDVGENETLYGAIRYDGDRRELPRSFAAPTFRTSTSFPAISNSWSSNTRRRKR